MNIVPTLILLVFAGIGATLIYRKYRKYQQSGQELDDKEIYSLGVQVFVLVILAALTLSSFTTVEIGYGAIVVDPILQQVRGPFLGEAWWFRTPWTRVVRIYYATLSTEMWTDIVENRTLTGEYPSVKVLSKDGLKIEVDILIRYTLLPEKLIELYRKYPDLRYEDKAISSVVREDIRDVVSNYTTLEVIEKRESLSDEMTKTILSSLTDSDTLMGALADIQIDLRNIELPQRFMDAVTEKQGAEQKKLQAEHERETLLIQADATAREAIRLAQGDAESALIIANATAEALKLISQEIDPALYYSLQQLEALAPNVEYLILTTGDEGVPILLTP